MSPVRRNGARRVLRGRRRGNASPLPDYWAADALAELGATVHLAHPLGVKAFSYRRVKNDQRDAADLADLLRMGRLPHAWIAPPETRELRELVRHRAKLVAMRSQCKAHVHAILAKGGIWVPMTDLFGVEGNLLLDKVTMPAPYKARIASLRRFIEAFDAEIDLFTGLAQRRLTHDAGYTAIQQIPGIGPVLAAVFVAEIGDVHRFAWPRPVDLLGRTNAVAPRIRHHGAPRPDHQARLAPGAVGGDRIGEDACPIPVTSARSANRSLIAAATATSAPWPPPEDSSSSSSTGCAITTSVPCTTHPARREQPDSVGCGSCRS